MAQWQTYREVLLEGFEKKKARRSDYSLRAFARDVGVTPSHLSDVLSGRRGLSTVLAAKIAAQLELTSDETARFIDLVEFEDARSANDRKLAALRLEKLSHEKSHSLQRDELEFLASWHLPVALELISVHSGRLDEDRIADALDIEPQEAQVAVEKLLALGMIQKVGDHFERAHDYLHVFSETPNTVLRNFHKQLLQLAIERLDQTSVKERQTLTSVVSIDLARLDEARNFLTETHKEFMKRFGTSRDAGAVYVFGQNFFRADIGEL